MNMDKKMRYCFFLVTVNIFKFTVSRIGPGLDQLPSSFISKIYLNSLCYVNEFICLTYFVMVQFFLPFRKTVSLI